MEVIQPDVQKATSDNSSVQVDQETLNTTFPFALKGSLDHTFIVAGPFEDCGVIIHKGSDRI